MSPSVLWMVSAPIDAGKTTLCRSLADQARAEGMAVAGLLSPALFEGGRKAGILAEDLRSGETRLLARATPHPGFDLSFGTWHFDPQVLDWGNRVLASSLPCDLLIVDELGPLELLRGQGWTSALAVLRQREYSLGLVVVRPSLQDTACVLLPVQRIIPCCAASTLLTQMLQVLLAT